RMHLTPPGRRRSPTSRRPSGPSPRSSSSPGSAPRSTSSPTAWSPGTPEPLEVLGQDRPGAQRACKAVHLGDEVVAHEPPVGDREVVGALVELLVEGVDNVLGVDALASQLAVRAAQLDS